MLSNGVNLTYGSVTNADSQSLVNRTFTFDTNEGLFGLWGYANDGLLQALGPITYNATACPTDGQPIDQGDENDSGSED